MNKADNEPNEPRYPTHFHTPRRKGGGSREGNRRETPEGKLYYMIYSLCNVVRGESMEERHREEWREERGEGNEDGEEGRGEVG